MRLTSPKRPGHTPQSQATNFKPGLLGLVKRSVRTPMNVGDKVSDNKVLIVGSSHLPLPRVLSREDSVFMPTPTQVQCKFDDLMSRMPTLADINASKHRKARIERARAKRRKNKR